MRPKIPLEFLVNVRYNLLRVKDFLKSGSRAAAFLLYCDLFQDSLPPPSTPLHGIATYGSTLWSGGSECLITLVESTLAKVYQNKQL